MLKPEDVLKVVAADFKINHLTHEEAAIRLKMRSKQTLSNLLSSKRYMSELNAERFHQAFGYNKAFLMTGNGSLYEGMPTRGAKDIDLSGLAYNKETKEFTVIDYSQPGDIELVLLWFREALSNQDNRDGLALWAEISRFTDAVSLVEKSMNGYSGAKDYREEFEERIFTLRSECVEKIHRMIEAMKIEKGS